MAFDSLHRVRHLKPLPSSTQRILSALLDFGGCTNAKLDNKDYCREELQRTRQVLDEAGLGPFVDELLRRLEDLEARRPSPRDRNRPFDEFRSYREDVVRLLLGMVATTAEGSCCLDEGIRAVYSDEDLKILYRIVMQCQIIDDVLDYSQDVSAGLPTFLTGSASLADAMKRTYRAARAYGKQRVPSQSQVVFSFRVALFFASSCAMLMIQLGRWSLSSPARP